MWLVQLYENHEFLCPSGDGDVSSTPWISRAGVFDSLEAAELTANYYVGENQYAIFDIFDFQPSHQ